MSKIDHIPQWGECSWSVHYWRLYLIRYYTLKAVKRCTQIWAYLWATHKNSYSKWRCPQIWGYLCEWLIVTCKNLCSSHFFRNWLFLKVNAILRWLNAVAHFWASLLGVVILTIPILVTVRKFRSSLTNAIFRWSTMENSCFGTTTRACRWTQFCAVILLVNVSFADCFKRE